MSTLQQRLKVVVTDRKGDRQANRAPQRVPSTDPIPELEHVLLADPKLGDGLGVGRKRDKVLRDVGFVLGGLQEPLPRRGGVGDRLLGRERLGRDDEQRRLRVAQADGLCQVGSVDVGHEVGRQVALGVRLERFRDHDGPQVGSADADVDDRVDGLARVALPLSAPHGLGELLDVGEDLLHLVRALLLDAEAVVQVPQRDVQHGSILRGVDVLAREHVVAGALDAGFLDEVEQSGENLVVDQVFGVVEQDGRSWVRRVGVFDRVLGEPVRVRGEEVLEDELGLFSVVELLQLLPCCVVCSQYVRYPSVSCLSNKREIEKNMNPPEARVPGMFLTGRARERWKSGNEKSDDRVKR